MKRYGAAEKRHTALPAWTFVEHPGVTLGEMRSRGKSAGQGHLDDSHIGLQQKLTRTIKTQTQVIARRCMAQVFGKKSFELTFGNADFPGERATVHSSLGILFHQPDGSKELRVPCPKTGCYRGALVIVTVADTLMVH